jgi:hypothetical protein|tara:strand:+ start:270 stop:479 length:210 start_codon:yes stop_codon:yes gene_type:complete
MDIKTLKSASQFFVRYNINTFVEDGKIYVDMGNCELELSDAEVKFRARCNDDLKERMNIKQLKENESNE